MSLIFTHTAVYKSDKMFSKATHTIHTWRLRKKHKPIYEITHCTTLGYNNYILCQLWWHKVPPQVQSKHLIKHFASLGSSCVMFSCSEAFDPWKQQQKWQWALCHSACYQPEPSACSTSSCKWPQSNTHTYTRSGSHYHN